MKIRRWVERSSSLPAWRIPWTEEPGGLQSRGHKSRARPSDFQFSSIQNAALDWTSASSLVTQRREVQSPELEPSALSSVRPRTRDDGEEL